MQQWLKWLATVVRTGLDKVLSMENWREVRVDHRHDQQEGFLHTSHTRDVFLILLRVQETASPSLVPHPVHSRDHQSASRRRSETNSEERLKVCVARAQLFVNFGLMLIDEARMLASRKRKRCIARLEALCSSMASIALDNASFSHIRWYS